MYEQNVPYHAIIMKMLRKIALSHLKQTHFNGFLSQLYLEGKSRNVSSSHKLFN